MSDNNRKAALSIYAGAFATILFTAIVLAGGNAGVSKSDSLATELAKNSEAIPTKFSENLLWDANKSLVISEDHSAYAASADATLESARRSSLQNSMGDTADHEYGNTTLPSTHNAVFSNYPTANVAADKSFIELVVADEASGEVDASKAELVQSLREYGQMNQFATWRSTFSSGMADYRMLSPSLASSGSASRGSLATIASIPVVDSKAPATITVAASSANPDLGPSVLQMAIDPQITAVTQNAAEPVPEPGSMALLLMGLLLIALRGRALRAG